MHFNLADVFERVANGRAGLLLPVAKLAGGKDLDVPGGAHRRAGEGRLDGLGVAG